MNINIEEAGNQVAELIITYGLNIFSAIFILIVGWMAAKWAGNLIGNALGRIPRFDKTLSQFLSSLVRYAIMVFTGIAVLSKFGVQTASLVAVLGAAGLAIGLAMQGTLSHVAAGVMILIFRPFKIGDYIEAGGQGGTVKTITLFTTELATPDNVQIIMPNSMVWDAAIKNYSYNKTRRYDFVVGVDYSDNIDKGLKTLMKLAKSDERILKDPEPKVMVTGLGDNAVNLQLRLWCSSSDYWPLRFDLNNNGKKVLEKAGLSIPFPQRTLHVVGGDAKDGVKKRASTNKKTKKKAS